MTRLRKFAFILQVVLFIYFIVVFGFLIYDLYQSHKEVRTLKQELKELKYQKENDKINLNKYPFNINKTLIQKKDC